MKNKDVSSINDSEYYESDEQVNTISDSNKKVDPRNNPIAETQIFDRVCTLSVKVGLFETYVVIGGRIGPVTNFLENLRVELPLENLSPLNTNELKAFVIGSQFESVGVTSSIARRRIVETFGGITVG